MSYGEFVLFLHFFNYHSSRFGPHSPPFWQPRRPILAGPLPLISPLSCPAPGRRHLDT